MADRPHRPAARRAGKGAARRQPEKARRTPEPSAPRSPRIPLFLATRNPGKVRELEALLADLPVRVHGAEQQEGLEHAVEDGRTFEANARKKALIYSRQMRELVLADDSGLEVDALGGEPGVRSARICGASATDMDRVRWILTRMENVPWEKRQARFCCVLALAYGGEILATFEGEVEGTISFEPEGSSGFGYDPIFYYPPMNMTFAEMEAEEKDSVSHRGQALARAVGWLREWIERSEEKGRT